MAMSGPSPRPVTGPSPRAIMSPAVRPRSVTRPSPSASSPLAVAGTKRPAPSSAIAALERAKKQKLAPGNAWIVAQVEEMQRHYKEALIAATMIVQFNADCKAIGYKSKPPRRLEVRFDAAWRNYSYTRRHIEWFIGQNHEYAADPIKFVARQRPPRIAPPPVPTPSPMTVGPMSVPPHVSQPQHAASPIPLASAGFLGTRPETGVGLGVGPGGVGVGLPGSMPIPTAAGMPPPPGFNDNLFGDVDLSSIGMDELNALIGGSADMPPQDFAAAGITAEPAAMTPNTSKLFETISGQQANAGAGVGASGNPPAASTPSAKPPTPAAATPSASTSMAPPPVPTPTGTATSAAAAPPAPAPRAAPAIGSGAAPANDFGFNFDSGDMDLSSIDMAALEGLFTGGGDGNGAGSGSSSGAGATGSAAGPTGANMAGFTLPSDDAKAPPSVPGGASLPVPTPPAPALASPLNVTAPVPAAPAPAVPAAEPVPTAAAEIPPAPPAAATEAPPIPVPVDAMMDYDMGAGDFSAIDFEDFNFDDGSMPNVDGDEFASLFAEFK